MSSSHLPSLNFAVIIFSHYSNRTFLPQSLMTSFLPILESFWIFICLISQQHFMLLAVFSILWHCSFLLCSALYSWFCFYLSGFVLFFFGLFASSPSFPCSSMLASLGLCLYYISLHFFPLRSLIHFCDFLWAFLSQLPKFYSWVPDLYVFLVDIG